jgi:hypothetical protein
MAPVHPVPRVEPTESSTGPACTADEPESDHVYVISVGSNLFGGCDYGDPVNSTGLGSVTSAFLCQVINEGDRIVEKQRWPPITAQIAQMRSTES